MITLYDTSLRDGLQGEKISLSLSDKLAAVKELDKLGVHYIEGGFPLASENEMKFFEEAKRIPLQHAKIVAFGSTKKPGVKPEDDFHMQALLKADTEIITIVGKTWSRHVKEVIQTDLDENLKMIGESIKYLKSQGKKVFYDAEHFFDGYFSDPNYAKLTLQVALESGADLVVLCDTNGGTLYNKLADLFSDIKQIPNLKYGVHFHNDTESAVANSLIALDYGAEQIQGTMNGWGERCGNTNLTSVMANIHFKTGYQVQTAEQIAHLTYVSRYFDELANVPPLDKQAYVGKSAFAHKAGQHADVILKNAELMEHIDSTLIGNSRRVLLSELAGKASIAYKMEKFGSFDKNSEEVGNLTRILKEKEQFGYEYEAAEASFELLTRKELKVYKPIIDSMEYKLDVRNDRHSEHIWAFVRVVIGDQEYTGDANSIGPVGALDHALRKALSQHYDFINLIHLSDYKVRVINGQDHTEAKVRVNILTRLDPGLTTKMETTTLRQSQVQAQAQAQAQALGQGQSWGTTGVSPNIIDATWQALIDSFDYAYNELNQVDL